MTETPARKRSMVIFPVMPRPPAAFSPLTMMKSKACFSFNFGSLAITAVRPGSPTISPRKRIVNICGHRIEEVLKVDVSFQKKAETMTKPRGTNLLSPRLGWLVRGEARMTKECPSTNGENLTRDFLTVSHFVLRHLPSIRHSVICHSSFVLLLFSPALQAADNLGVLGSKPKWGVLEHYQETITKDEFTELIQNVYCTHGIAPDLMEINTDTARILTNREPQEFFTLRFAKNDTSR